MNSKNEKVIELSKTKALFLIVGACTGVALGLWLVQIPSAEIEAQNRFNNPIILHGLGWLTVIFCTLSSASGVKKMFDKKPGLILSSAGIFDNSTAVSAGLIPWSEITGFAIFEAHEQKMLIISVSNPEKYINKGGFLKRFLNKANFNMCGSPIAITANSLKIGFDELLDSCNQYLATYGK